jgi:hypothetical protein
MGKTDPGCPDEQDQIKAQKSTGSDFLQTKSYLLKNDPLFDIEKCDLQA